MKNVKSLKLLVLSIAMSAGMGAQAAEFITITNGVSFDNTIETGASITEKGRRLKCLLEGGLWVNGECRM